MNSKNFLRASALLYLADGFASRTNLCFARNGIELTALFNSSSLIGARIETRRVHVRAGGIGEDQTEFRQVGA